MNDNLIGSQLLQQPHSPKMNCWWSEVSKRLHENVSILSSHKSGRSHKIGQTAGTNTSMADGN